MASPSRPRQRAEMELRQVEEIAHNRLASKGTPCRGIHILAIRMFKCRQGNLQIVANKPSAKGKV